MQRLFLLSFLPLLLFAFTLAASEEKQSSPNIVVIFIDDMGYADIGPFGSKVPTPNLDRMAAEGRRFTHFVVPSPVCSASRAALMTGCYNRRVGIHGALGPNSRIGLDPAEETIADICKKKGYATACFGKWHLGDRPEFLPLRQGFDEYFGLPYSNDMWPRHPDYVNLPPDAEQRKRGYPPLPLIDGDRIVDPDVRDDVQKQLTTLYTERAVDFIKRHRDRPFFLYVPHSMVHVPLFVSDKFAGKSGAGLFGDVVMEVDWSVGRILDTLRETGIDEKTLVIFTSDNGPWLSYGSHAGSAVPFREGKGTCFEGGVREPTLMRWPGRIPAGTECAALASTIDFLPTIAHLIDAPLPERKIDGKDIRPLLFNTPGAVSPHTALVLEYERQFRAVRDTRWKLVLPHTYRTLDGRVGRDDGMPIPYTQKKTETTLYDLENDPGETRDVGNEHPEIVARLRAAVEAIREELGEGDKPGPEMRPPGRL